MDYVLCYKYKKRRTSKPRLSLSSNGSLPIPIPMPIPIQGRWEAEAESGEPGAHAGDAEESKLTEEEKALMREEFEAGLLEAGLQIERDKEVCMCCYRAFTVNIVVYSFELSLSDSTTNPMIGQLPSR